jgi:hypothetical protein
METVKNFVDNIISNPPTNLDDSLQKEREFEEIIQSSNLSGEDIKELNNYLRDLYNTYLEKVKNCVPSQGGKKSRRRKHKKRNTLTRGVKRGGGFFQDILVFGVISTIIYIVYKVSSEEHRRDTRQGLQGYDDGQPAYAPSSYGARYDGHFGRNS